MWPKSGSFDAMIDHLNAVVLPVRDLEKCSSFYSSKLGFKLKNKDENSAFFGIGDKERVILGLISIDNVAELISEEQVRPREETIHRTYYAVFVDDVDREYQDLKRKGVHFVKPPTTQPWGQRIAYFEDPEGNLWEISHFPKSRETRTSLYSNICSPAIMTSTSSDFSRHVRVSLRKQKIMRLFQARISRLERGLVEISADNRPDLEQQGGHIHAGALVALADSAGGYATLSLLPSGSRVLSVEAKLNFLRPSVGSMIVGRGRVRKIGRTITACEL